MFRRCLLLLIILLGMAAPDGGICADSRGKLYFVTQDFRPFSFMKDGAVQGPFKDCFEAVCAEAGIACTFELLPWGRAQDYVKRGRADALFPIGWNDERAEWLRSSPPVIRTEYGFFANSKSRVRFSSIGELDGRTVAVYGPSNTSNQLHRLWKSRKGFFIDMRPDDEAGFNKLDKMRVDFVFSNRDAGDAIIRELQLRHVEYTGSYLPVDYVIGFTQKQEQQPTIDAFLAAMAKLKKQGKLDVYFTRVGLTPTR